MQNTLLDSFLKCRLHLYRMLGRIVRPEEIEDIVQETFVQSYAASRQQKIANPEAFMMKVAKNIALGYLRRADRKNCSIEEIEEEFLLDLDTTALKCQSQERFLSFCNAVATLPVSCRRVFILKKVYGLSVEEIGDLLGISKSTIEKHVGKGMAMVIEYMSESMSNSNVAAEPAENIRSTGAK